MPRLSKIGAAALAAFGWSSGGASAVTASYLVVAGGGGGGGASTVGNAGAGGGGGGFRTGTTTLNPTLSYSVTVGAGGTGGAGGSGSTGYNATNGSASVFNAISSAGGGFGACYNATSAVSGRVGGSGGSGGGSLATNSGGAGNTPSTSPSQGNNAGTSIDDGGSGGGGAGAVGGNATATSGGNGGAGATSSISGASVTYAGGGGGAGRPSSGGSNGTGGAGGGGTASTANPANSGAANTGGGGAGNTDGANNFTAGYIGGNGGSGIVIISYAGAQQFGGGVVTSVGGNTIHTFTTSGTLSPLSSLSASYLVVAGGGAGGGAQDTAGGGGGGAGGLRSGSGLTIDSNSTYLVTVGGGGTGGLQANGTKGSDSAFLSITSTGGGYGAVEGSTPPNYYGVGGDGGSGGGGSRGGAAGSGNTPSTSPSQGNNAGTSTIFGAAGGGGSGAVGGNGAAITGGTGGAGTASSISGSSVTYAGGGGGGVYTTGTPGSGGVGGGGAGGAANGSNGFAGTANLGGGGGGASGGGSTQRSGGNGGSGVVIISYPGSTPQMSGGTVTIVGGNVIHTFTSSGYLSPIVLLNRSLRFRSSASAYVNRTFGTPTTRNQWTWSGWVKRGTLGSYQVLFCGDDGSSNNFLTFRFGDTDTLNCYQISGGSYNLQVNTSAVFRDPAAWYHVVFVYNSPSATSTDRIQIYVNGTRQAVSYSIGPFAQNTDSQANVASRPHAMGRILYASTHYLDGYMTEINFIDGQALTPSSFGSFNAYGSWSPVRYGGSYGTNGFYLPFTNNISTTTLGYDFSPNGNNWTTNNISLTSGYTYDSMTDVPTLTSTTAANYAVLNPLARFTGANAPTISNGNLLTTSGGNPTHTIGSIAAPVAGKFYFEIACTSIDTNRTYIGFLTTQTNAFASGGTASYNLTYSAFYSSDGNKYYNTGSSQFAAFGASYTTGDVIGVAYDNGNIWWAKNGVWQASGNPTTGANPALTGWNAYGDLYPYVGFSSTFTANFGQQPFVYTPPSGFVALNTYNL